LAHRIATVIKQRGLTQARAAHLLGASQSRVSLVVTGQLDGFTIDRLLRYLTALDEDVEIAVRHAQGPVRLRVALG